ncbi:Transcription initiation factor IIF subunit beta [Phytophthora nicotianae]|uniref:Transcription initiation factor IIF subunit beta n=1 Tax=Phytophthora nicotianae TaxID=4792 RepID=A0A0W8DPW7_PHYNI|nr:Transcription initiation factor IIF subunit beta [Phytophthora nicotianae]
MEGGIWAFYYLQGEDGEDRSHPNAFKLTGLSPGTDVTLADVLRSFPLRNPSAFHFRFRLNSNKGNTFYWLDVTQPTQKVPLAGGRVICKLLRLERPQKPGLVFRRRPVLKWASGSQPPKRQGSSSALGDSSSSVQSAKAVQPLGESSNFHRSSSSPGFEQGRPAKYSDRAPGSGNGAESRHSNSSSRTSSTSGDKKPVSRTGSGSKTTEAQGNLEDFLASAVLGPRLKAWAEDNGRVKNIRTLLSTMHQVMWEDCKWTEVNMGKLIQPNDIKKHYRKAMIVVHPDKSGGRNAEQLLIAERVFAALNTAWEDFQKTNPC